MPKSKHNKYYTEYTLLCTTAYTEPVNMYTEISFQKISLYQLFTPLKHWQNSTQKSRSNKIGRKNSVSD